MVYLQPSEYETYGLESTTPAALVAAASSLIDSHCRRPTLAVAQYVERVRLRERRNTVRLSYLPLTPVAPATPALTVRAGAVDRMQLQYFSGDLLDPGVRAHLAPYVSQKAG